MEVNDELQMIWKELAVVSLGNLLPFVFGDWEILLKATSYSVPVLRFKPDTSRIQVIGVTVLSQRVHWKIPASQLGDVALCSVPYSKECIWPAKIATMVGGNIQIMYKTWVCHCVAFGRHLLGVSYITLLKSNFCTAHTLQNVIVLPYNHKTFQDFSCVCF
jgi:hypothetical protein